MSEVFEMIWKIAQAKKRFSEMIHKAKREPQMIYNRNNIVAAVVNAEEYEEFKNYKRKMESDSLENAFSKFREICTEENYEIILPERKNRTVDWI